MVHKIYSDGRYLKNNPTWHEEDSPWKAAQIAKILLKNDIHPTSICEIGCGAGEILRSLKKNLGGKAKYSGYEISPQAFDICKQKETENLEFHLADLLADNEMRFDVVMAIDVFEHVEDYLGFLRKLRSKGRYQIFHIPLDLSVQTVFRGSPITNVRNSVGHIHYFTKETALATLADTGYEVLDYFYTNGSLEIPNRGWKSWLLKIPRRIFLSIHKDWSVRILGGSSLLVLTR
jgi:SAM-dependent methyltransferase